jgi:hypothetical protein
VSESYGGGAGGLEFLEPGLEVVVGLEVVEDFGWGVPVLDFDVRVWKVAWDFVVEVAMVGVVGWMNPDDSMGGDLAVTILVRDRGDAEFDGCFFGTFVGTLVDSDVRSERAQKSTGPRSTGCRPCVGFSAVQPIANSRFRPPATRSR